MRGDEDDNGGKDRGEEGWGVRGFVPGLGRCRHLKHV